MPGSDEQTKLLIENLSANIATTSQLINSLLGDIRDNAANLMELKLKMESLSENVKSITNIVRDGNGKGSMVTRVAVLEKAIEDLEDDIDQIRDENGLRIAGIDRKLEEFQTFINSSIVKDADNKNKEINDAKDFKRERVLAITRWAVVATPGLLALVMALVDKFLK